ncbi:hemerythrin domain-containing protein [Mycolicibacter senuensis]|uniref:Hemerythrin n=1 Tax=Mycolicibacter senuensis TaxID=386913 RepID=A0A7I9XGE0_9MYCO|nr:hemerythrin domain-containing protein [Mycolicibacter senuensis]MDQ2627491.1 hemerythrin domain-containing protein [Actinomycetota bacterium]ORW66680.1 cation-binding protein [Mycolicibacter senuensis]GFG68560.1 hemerythrin [Mycolicibacter senuensis]
MADSEQDSATADVVDILTTDHNEMIDLLTEIEGTVDTDTQRDLADTVTAEVMRHSVAEEMFVYPVVEDKLPGGADDVKHDKEEHDELVQLMKKLEDVSASDPAFLDLAGQLKSLLRHHANDEESEQFPKLREHLSAKELVEMGEKVQTAKKVAPTRPHPQAPHSELFHKTLGAGVGMVDRIRDKLTGRQTG